jgi:hypothetical protein
MASARTSGASDEPSTWPELLFARSASRVNAMTRIRAAATSCAITKLGATRVRALPPFARWQFRRAGRECPVFGTFLPLLGPNGNTALGRCYPLAGPSANVRYLRIPAIAAPSSDNKIHFRDSSCLRRLYFFVQPIRQLI